MKKTTTIEWRDIRDEEPNEGDRVYYVTKHGMDIGDVIRRHITDFECHHCFDHDVLFWAPYDKEDLPKRDEVIESLQAIVPGNWERDGDGIFECRFGDFRIGITPESAVVARGGYIILEVKRRGMEPKEILKKLVNLLEKQRGETNEASRALYGVRVWGPV